MRNDPTVGDQFFLVESGTLRWEKFGRSRASGAQPAVLLVGGFHVVEQGGTVLEYLHHRPSDELLVVSLVPEQKLFLPRDLLGKADIFILTGLHDEVGP